MRIEVFAGFGSPDGLTPDLIWTRGVGGAELALMQWAETMGRRGHEITIYNDPLKHGVYGKGNVMYVPRRLFNHKDPHDVVIAFRGPIGHNSRQLYNSRPNPTRKFVFWSTDQFTYGDYDQDVFPYVDHTVTISQRHTQYFMQRYTQLDATKVTHLDLGVVAEDYHHAVERDPNQLIYCSVPDRGLEVLHRAWPRIKQSWPEAHLVITADYRLWGSLDPQNSKHTSMWRGMPDVQFVGAIPRAQLIDLQLKSSVQTYPCTYDELFCIAVAECQVAGAIPVSSRIGAVRTTQIAGTQHPPYDGSEQWVESFANSLTEYKAGAVNLETNRVSMVEKATKRFDWEVICKQWEEILG